MVDALLYAVAESESEDCTSPSPLLEMKRTDGDRDPFLMSMMEYEGDAHHHPVRFCEFCNSSNTPTWRRGPAGKGSLCNACGIKWRLRKRMKTEKRASSSSSSVPGSPSSSPMLTKHSKKRKIDHQVPQDDIPMKRESSSPKRKKYYCKYCNQTWALSHFRNSQQFGAHCSNCSRRPKDGEERDDQDDLRDYADDNDRERDYEYHMELERENKYHHHHRDREERYHVPHSPALWTPSPPSPMIPESPPQPKPRKDGLLMRLLHVVEHELVEVHELAEVKTELTTLKSDLLKREEARRSELKQFQARMNQDIAELRGRLNESVNSHKEKMKENVNSHKESTVKKMTEVEHGFRRV